MFKSEVLSVGSATVDTFLTIEQSLSKIKLGDKILVKEMEKHSGGGATNAAAALAKLGLKVKVLTKLGDDHDADFVNAEIRKYKVKNICLQKSKKNTDSATILSSQKEKDRIIYVHKGASRDLSVKDFKKSHLSTRWIYLATLMGKSFQAANFIARNKRKKTKLLFNPSLYLAEKGKKSLRTILRAADILILNQKEARALLKKNTDNTLTLLKGLQDCGPEMVIVTNGSKKMYAINSDGVVYSLVPPKVKVIHTAGAGDAFNSGFLAGMIKRYSFEDCLKLGQANASSVIQQIGTKNGLLSEKEVLRLIKKYKIKVKSMKS